MNEEHHNDGSHVPAVTPTEVNDEDDAWVTSPYEELETPQDDEIYS